MASIKAQLKAKEQLQEQDLKETKALVEKLVAEKTQEDLEVEQMADEIE